MSMWLTVELATLVVGLPVLVLGYYYILLLWTSRRYPRDLGAREVKLSTFPAVSILIATFNERFVIRRSLDAIKNLDYPKDKLQVVVADDSNDQTVQVIDEGVRDLKAAGIRATVSRRPGRLNFKCGALNKALGFADGEYVLLLDADSVVAPDTLSKGIDAMNRHPRTGFVSFRYGHYNREFNLVTRLFALTQDLGDTLSKMGAYSIDAPFSFQGGFTLVKANDLRSVGGWSNERIADDTDISIKMYLAGKRGIYLSNVKIMSEDVSTLEAWKKQVARTSQGWWRCIAKYWKDIIGASAVSPQKRLGLILMLMSPFSSLSWIIVTFLSAIAVIFHYVSPVTSLFSNPMYIAIVTIPFAVSLASAAWALKVQNLMTPRNIVLIPLLGYANGCMLILGSMACFYGIFDRMGFFLYRTPKSGPIKELGKSKYFSDLSNDKHAIIEGALAVTGLVFAVMVFFDGVWFLALTLAGFGIFTLKSMNLTRHLFQKPELRR